MISKTLLDKIYSIVDQKKYIEGKININEIKDIFGNNMLSYVETVEDIDYLIAKGINIHNRNNYNENVLFGSSALLFHKDKELKDKILNKFFDLGINPNVINSKGGGILSSLYFFNNPELYIKNKDKIINKDVLLNGIYANNRRTFIDIIKMLKNEGFNVIFPDFIYSETSIDRDNLLKTFIAKMDENNKIIIRINPLIPESLSIEDKKELIDTDLEKYKSTLNVLNFIKEICNPFTYRFLIVIYSKDNMGKGIISMKEYHHEVEEIVKYLEKERRLINFNVI